MASYNDRNRKALLQLSSLECENETCDELPTMDFFMCEEGHFICQDCCRDLKPSENWGKIRFWHCPNPICTGLVPDFRESPMVLMAVFRRLEFECINKHLGCPTISPNIDDIKRHESICSHVQSKRKRISISTSAWLMLMWVAVCAFVIYQVSSPK